MRFSFLVSRIFPDYRILGLLHQEVHYPRGIYKVQFSPTRRLVAD